MSVGWLFNTLAGGLLLPPLGLILLCAAGIWLRPRRPRAGVTLAVFALAILAVLSTRAGARLLVTPLESLNQPLARIGDAQAIVVLGGGRMAGAPEYDGSDVPTLTAAARLRYAARLHRRTGLPILLTGGSPDGSREPEAALMARTLRDDFGVSAQWLEQRSNNTAENARLSKVMLQATGIDRILLVTDAIHMQRARRIFESSGFAVQPAATLFFSYGPLTPADFVPDGEGLRRSGYAAHEWLGLLWYRLRY